jgi:hypothetical protein
VSTVSRIVIALFSLFCGLSFIWLAAEGFIPNAAGGYIVGGVCVAIAVMCLSTELRPFIARIIGAAVFLGCCGYLYSELTHPHPIIQRRAYHKSDTNPLNATLAFIAFGLPAGFVAVTGKFPTWTRLGDKLSKPQDGQNYPGQGQF